MLTATIYEYDGPLVIICPASVFRAGETRPCRQELARGLAVIVIPNTIGVIPRVLTHGTARFCSNCSGTLVSTHPRIFQDRDTARRVLHTLPEGRPLSAHIFAGVTGPDGAEVPFDRLRPVTEKGFSRFWDGTLRP